MTDFEQTKIIIQRWILQGDMRTSSAYVERLVLHTWKPHSSRGKVASRPGTLEAMASSFVLAVLSGQPFLYMAVYALLQPYKAGCSGHVQWFFFQFLSFVMVKVFKPRDMMCVLHPSPQKTIIAFALSSNKKRHF